MNLGWSVKDIVPKHMLFVSRNVIMIKYVPVTVPEIMPTAVKVSVYPTLPEMSEI